MKTLQELEQFVNSHRAATFRDFFAILGLVSELIRRNEFEGDEKKRMEFRMEAYDDGKEPLTFNQFVVWLGSCKSGVITTNFHGVVKENTSIEEQCHLKSVVVHNKDGNEDNSFVSTLNDICDKVTDRKWKMKNDNTEWCTEKEIREKFGFSYFYFRYIVSQDVIKTRIDEFGGTLYSFDDFLYLSERGAV